MPKKTITGTRQYLCDLAIYLHPRSCRDFTIIREKYKVWQYSFYLSQKLQQRNPNHQNTFSTSCTQDSQWATNGPKKFPRGVAPRPPEGLSMSTIIQACWAKPPLHRLSLKKSPIKNHATLFESSQVVNRIKHN